MVTLVVLVFDGDAVMAALLRIVVGGGDDDVC